MSTAGAGVDEVMKGPPPTDLLFLSTCPTQEKCYQYWPDQGCWTYGNVRVCVEDCVVLVDYTIRKFCIQSVSTRLLAEAGLRGDTHVRVLSQEALASPLHPLPQQLSQGETRLEAVPGREAGWSLVGHRSESTGQPTGRCT